MSSPPPVPTTPGSNVTPMWGGGTQPPWLRPGPMPPSCFSQLYALNQCYDDILAMKAILAKVVCDLATNDTDFAKCLAAGIAAVGAGSPLTGVTDGSNAATGIVGEWVFSEQSGAITGAQAQITLLSVTMQPGDWDCWAMMTMTTFVNDAGFILNPSPAGMSDQMQAGILVPSGGTAGVTLVGSPARLSTAVPVLLPFQLEFNAAAAGTAGTFSFTFKARRVR